MSVQQAYGIASQVTASGNTDPFSLPGGGYTDLLLAAGVTAITSGTTVTVALQQQTGAGWVTVCETSALSSAGAALETGAPEQPGGMFQITWTLGGTAGLAALSAFAAQV